MDDAAQAYIDAIDPTFRPLFDRLHGLILELFPTVEVVISYQMPTYKVDPYRLYVGVWKHGLSVYGWDQGREAAFLARHPDLKTNKGTIKIGLADAERIGDDDLRELVRAALGG